ncbi:MAG: diguanylate cyclase domain-containing protein [Inhella sp.]|jgi:diguanylate cyclase (GGDEF)-like protein|uniref:GGDEF domain-containing protein n=1 Tax=Inhella sp. TaxID=1921806 RepID=UPI0022C22397|nr:tetratricopeptide repeat-containing diguanylate cyclase [Inhella sp.]MCZ8235493.1 diguanylate cyclase [Inhella sp.]
MPTASSASTLEQLDAIAQLHERDAPRALRELEALRATVPARDPMALEALYLLAAFRQTAKDEAALAALEPAFQAWMQDSDARSATLGRVAWQLLQYRKHALARDLPAARGALEAIRLTPQQEQGLPSLWRWRLNERRATAAEQQGKLDDAQAYRLSAVRAAEETGEPRRAIETMTALAFTYGIQGDQAAAQSWIDQAVARMEANASRLSNLEQANVLTALGAVQTDAGRLDDAARSYERALAILTKDGDVPTRAVLLGNLADIGLKTRNYPRAIRLSEEALALGIASKNRASEALANHNMGVAKIAMGRVAEGKAQVMKAIAIEREDGNLVEMSQGWAELGHYLETAGDLAGAMSAYAEYRTLADSLEREDRRKALLEAQQRYDDDRRMAEGESLRKANDLNTALAEARRLQLLLWALVLACGVAAVVLLVGLWRRTRDANRLLAQSNEVLAEQSERDPLTGLGNRHQLTRLLAQPGRRQGAVGSLFLVDVDFFKQVNDRHGHAAGDQVLVEIGQRLRQATRDGDAVLRWGGEEFLVLTDAQDPAVAQALAQRVLNSVAESPVVLADGHWVPVSVSMGFARFPLAEAPIPWEAALELVDQLMYRAKAHGRNQAWSLTELHAPSAQDLPALMAEADAAQERGDLSLIQLRGPRLAEAGA